MARPTKAETRTSVLAAYKKLAASLGRPPSNGEIAKDVGLTKGTVSSCRRGLATEKLVEPSLKGRGVSVAVKGIPSKRAAKAKGSATPSRRTTTRSKGPAGGGTLLEHLVAKRDELRAQADAIDMTICVLGGTP